MCSPSPPWPSWYILLHLFWLVSLGAFFVSRLRSPIQYKFQFHVHFSLQQEEKWSKKNTSFELNSNITRKTRLSWYNEYSRFFSSSFPLRNRCGGAFKVFSCTALHFTPPSSRLLFALGEFRTLDLSMSRTDGSFSPSSSKSLLLNHAREPRAEIQRCAVTHFITFLATAFAISCATA